jgi:hypothetical protein
LLLLCTKKLNLLFLDFFPLLFGPFSKTPKISIFFFQKISLDHFGVIVNEGHENQAMPIEMVFIEPHKFV